MLKNKCNTTIARDVTESSLKKLKITGIVTSRIPVMHLPYILDYKNPRIIRTFCLNDQFWETFIVFRQLTHSVFSKHCLFRFSSSGAMQPYVQVPMGPISCRVMPLWPKTHHTSHMHQNGNFCRMSAPKSSQELAGRGYQTVQYSK
mgnify:CR=1 FL=1